MKKIGLITIGQSPRPDIVKEIKFELGKNIDIFEIGALDNLGKNEILNLVKMSSNANNLLVTKLRDETIIKISKNIIDDKIKYILKQIEREKITIAGILCVGDFPNYQFNGVLLRPSELISKLVTSLGENKGLVVIPLVEELENASKRWNIGNLNCQIKVVPHGSKMSIVNRLVDELKDTNPSFVVLECMSYNKNMQKIFCDKFNCPVILPKTLLAGTLKEIL